MVALCRIFPRSAVGAADTFRGLGVAGDLLLVRVPCQAAAELEREIREHGQHAAAVRGFDVRDGLAVLLDSCEEVFPKQREVVTVGLLDLRVFVDDLCFLIRRVERPAVAPAVLPTRMLPRRY